MQDKTAFNNGWNVAGTSDPVNHSLTIDQFWATFGKDSSADVTVSSHEYYNDDKEYKVHSAILSIRSPVFASMFAEGGSLFGKEEKKLYVEHLFDKGMEAFIAYLYDKEYPGWEDWVGELAAAANEYEIPALKTVCVASMTARVSVENAAEFFYYAFMCKSDELMRTIAKFISEHKAAVFASDGWDEHINDSDEFEIMKTLIEFSI